LVLGFTVSAQDNDEQRKFAGTWEAKYKGAVVCTIKLQVGERMVAKGANDMNVVLRIESVSGDDRIFRLKSNNGPGTTLALMEMAAAASIGVESLSVQSTTLDDVFVHYTGRGLRDALQEASAKDSPFMIRRA